MYPWAKKYVGLPFVSGGRDQTGVDCYGLVRLVLATEYGIKLPLLLGDYTNALDVAEAKKMFSKNIPVLLCEKIDKPEEKAVALIRMCGRLCHVGLYAGEGFIIHSRHKTGVVLERISAPTLAGCVEGWYRVDPCYSLPKSVLCGKD